MARYFRKKKFSKKSIIALVVAAIIIIGAICGIAIAINNANAERKTLSLSYSVGGLTDTGAYKASETSIYTKSAFVCDGLEIDLDDNSDVKFEVYYYGKSGAFISSTGMMSKDYVAELKNGEKTARIVVTPVFSQPIDEEDVAGYAKQLKVSVLNPDFVDSTVADLGNPFMRELDIDTTYLLTIGAQKSSPLHDEMDKNNNPQGVILTLYLFGLDRYDSVEVLNSQFNLVTDTDDVVVYTSEICVSSMIEIMQRGSDFDLDVISAYLDLSRIISYVYGNDTSDLCYFDISVVE